MINESTFEKIFQHLEFKALDELWAVTLFPSEFDFPKKYSTLYMGRIELFCQVLKWLLFNMKMRLANHGIFLEGTPQEQVNIFKKSFPKTEEEMLEKEHYWWYLDECPGGAVWYTDIDDHGFQTTPVGDGRFYYWT